MPNQLSISTRPLRVAIIGSGPSGFYAAESLLSVNRNVNVTLFDRLPAPFGLVRYGVAPDHAKIKNVIKIYEKISQQPGFSFLGNVNVGADIAVKELQIFFDAIIFAYGAQTDRKLGIPGENLQGCHSATEFVAWYNGHPHYRHLQFDLSRESAIVVGQGNVAVDVCRMLCKSVEELKNTDIAAHALTALSESKIKEVHMIGRRGPAQAAFTPVEIREFAELKSFTTIIHPHDLELNEASIQELADPKNAAKKKNYEILKKIAGQEPGGTKKFFIHFFKSPSKLVAHRLALAEMNHVYKIMLEKNHLSGEANHQSPQGTGESEELNCGIFFSSVGYRGLAIPQIPFDDKKGIISNREGRVVTSLGEICLGLYATGWIKRGASGVIGTNKPDADETVKHLCDDIENLIPCQEPNQESFLDFLMKKNIRFVTFADWKKIDEAEIARGQKVGKPREKFVSVEEMLAVIK